MVDFFRKWAWKFSGINEYRFLRENHSAWLKDSKWLKIWCWFDGSALHIGNDCQIAPNVRFLCDSGYSEVTKFPPFNQTGHKDQTAACWNLPIQKIAYALDDFYLPIAEFIQKYS